MNPRLQRYLADLRDRLPRDVASQARVAEAQLHLEQTAADLRAADPSLAEDEALGQAIEKFGLPEDFHPWPARGRPRWRARLSTRTRRLVLAAAVLALVIGAAAGAIVEAHEEHEDLFRRRVELSHHTGPMNESFEVPAGIVVLRFSVHADHEEGAPACANVTVRNPVGRIALQAGSTCSRIDADLPAAVGTWVVRFDLRDFTGTLDTDIHAETHA
jgi:hypothetical protein